MKKKRPHIYIPFMFMDGRNQSISKNLTISLTFLVCFVVTIILTFIYFKQSHTLRQELEQKADEYTFRIAEILVDPMWNLNQDGIKQVGLVFEQSQWIDYIRIADSEGNIVFESNTRDDMSAEITRFKQIEYQGWILGRVETALSLRQYNEQLSLLLKTTGLTLVGTIIVIVVATGLLLNVLLRKPLIELQRGIDWVSEGDYSYTFESICQRELVGIARKFSEMAAKVQAREDTLQHINRKLQEEIAERKQVEEELQKHREHLEELVEERTAELKRINKALQREVIDHKRTEKERERLNAELTQKNNELEQIVYVTSHDLRSPLVNVQGFSKELKYSLQEVDSLLQDERVPDTIREALTSIMKEDIQEALGYILTGVAKMDALLAGLLKLSRLGRAALTITELDMNDLISAVIRAFEFQIKEAEITLEVSDLPACRGDASQIDQVFSNLLGNALKFLDSSRPGTIRISGSVRGDQAIYCVEDNGIGIALEHQKQIFEIFHRLNPEQSRGDGLGLNIVQRILERHHGKVWVESEPDAGSKFYVTLPDSGLEVGL